MSDEEYARYMRDLQDAAEQEHKRVMRRYKVQFLFAEVLAAIVLIGITGWIIEVLS